ncbi:hypothetical protein RE9425_03050 [Prescottella equi]|nr:hypothetical protein RE9425_03050 [Prescottella equi]
MTYPQPPYDPAAPPAGPQRKRLWSGSWWEWNWKKRAVVLLAVMVVVGGFINLGRYLEKSDTDRASSAKSSAEVNGLIDAAVQVQEDRAQQLNILVARYGLPDFMKMDLEKAGVVGFNVCNAIGDGHSRLDVVTQLRKETLYDPEEVSQFVSMAIAAMCPQYPHDTQYDRFVR